MLAPGRGKRRAAMLQRHFGGCGHRVRPCRAEYRPTALLADLARWLAPAAATLRDHRSDAVPRCRDRSIAFVVRGSGGRRGFRGD